MLRDGRRERGSLKRTPQFNRKINNVLLLKCNINLQSSATTSRDPGAIGKYHAVFGMSSPNGESQDSILISGGQNTPYTLETLHMHSHFMQNYRATRYEIRNRKYAIAKQTHIQTLLQTTHKNFTQLTRLGCGVGDALNKRNQQKN